MFLNDFKVICDDTLHSIVKEYSDKYPNVRKRNAIDSLLGYINDFLFSGGKRIRPYLVYLVYVSYGGDKKDDCLKISCAFELLHTMALVHDDIMDKGTKRHGVQTFHEYAKTLYAGENAYHLGISQGMLIGDLIFGWAYTLIHGVYDFDALSLKKLQDNFHVMVDEVVLGQMIDVDIMSGTEVDSEKLRLKNYYKSASYTFVRPMTSGAMLAGLSGTELKKIEMLGENFGLAYQIRDDLLDIIDDKTDKTPCSDIQDGQQTYLTDYIHIHGTDQQKEFLNSMMNKKLSAQEILDVKQFFTDTGAIDYCKKLINEYLKNASKIIEELDITNKHYFYTIVELLTV